MSKRKEQLESLMDKIKSVAISTDRDNANIGNNFSAKLLQIASAASKVSNTLRIPEHIVEAYEKGLIHIHDLDSYDLTINCLHIPTGEALKRGFNTGYGTINTPKRIDAAASLSCIILQSSQNDMFGGQSFYDFDNDLADFAESTEVELIKEEIQSYIEYVDTPEFDAICSVADLGCLEIKELKLEDLPLNAQNRILVRVDLKLIKAINQAMQIVVYNLNSMHSRAGSQIPFSSLNIGIPKNKYAAMICQYFLEKYDEGLGKHEQPIFPNIIFRVKEGVNREPGDPFYYLYKLACKVASKRMNPTFLNIDATFNKVFYDKGILPATMGCRTAVSGNINGEETPKGRGNNAPVSMNLVKMAIEAVSYTKRINERPGNKGRERVGEALIKRNLEVFYELLDETLELCKEQLLHRYETLKQLKGKDLPFIIGEGLIMGASEVGPDDSIDPVLKHGTWGIGFIGVAETLKCLLGVHHGESQMAYEEAIKIVKHIRDYCDKIKVWYKMNFTCYATPAEGLSGRFTAIDLETYGSITGITDRGFYTNSFHIPVDCSISIKRKLELEAPFHELCNAGHISYFELDAAPVDDSDIIERVVTNAFRTTNIGYIGANFGIRYCKECGTNHVYGPTCPKCKSSRIQGIHRVTGYLSLDERFGDGKSAEVKLRRSHL